jgi:hypothetical protein
MGAEVRPDPEAENQLDPSLTGNRLLIYSGLTDGRSVHLRPALL